MYVEMAMVWNDQHGSVFRLSFAKLPVFVSVVDNVVPAEIPVSGNVEVAALELK